MWDDFIHEESREEALRSKQSKSEENEKSVSLVAKNKGKKKDMSKVRCFAFQQKVHYASQCLNKKRNKKDVEIVASAKVDELTGKFKK